MSERAKGCTVAFAGGLRDADIDGVISAIGQLRHVVSVVPTLETSEDWIAEQRAKLALEIDLLTLLRRDNAS